MDEESVSTIYPSIYHYTNDGGLEGILRTKSLWATHYRFLNDTKELRVFIEMFKHRIGFSNEVSPEEQKRKLQEADKKLHWLIDYLDEHSPHYLACFCPEDPFGTQNGRLSQWIRYGRDDGYAIEFDTSQLERMLKIEGSSELLYSIGVGFKSVGYFNEVTSKICRHGFDLTKEEEEDNNKTIVAIEKKLKELFELLRGDIPGSSELPTYIQQCMELLSYSATRIKHYGFHEECEIRMVAPATVQGVLDGEKLDIKAKAIYFRPQDKAPYIILFEEDKFDELFKKSIKGIIIGPGFHQERRKIKVEMLLKQYGYLHNQINIRCSNIPFVR